MKYEDFLKTKVELNPQYFLDGATHLKAAENKINVPTLFDFVNEAV